MEVIIRESVEAATELVARVIADEIRAKPDAVLGLATGQTMEAVYERLVHMHLKEGLDFSRCRTFNLDEYVGLPGTDSRSYRHYMDHHLFGRINIDRKHTHVPDGTADNLNEECARYEQLIAKHGGIDLQLLGIGLSGHLGFNEPASSLRSRTRVKVLAPATHAQNAIYFQPPEKMPNRAITMGVGTILDARRCVLLATGKRKAEIVAKAVEGPVTSMISATALQMHPNCAVVVDSDAGSRLKERDYYQWVFENESAWLPFRSEVHHNGNGRDGHAGATRQANSHAASATNGYPDVPPRDA